jgi:hypothetical protein
MPLVSYLSTPIAVPAALFNRVEVTTPLHRAIPRPFEPRVFKRREFEANDVHGFLSLKESRPVEVAGLAPIAVALALECNPRVAAYTERPRYLRAGEQTVELDFWVRHATGFEEFLLVVGDGQCLGVAAGVPRPRDGERLQAAADAAGINLTFVAETHVRQAGVQVGVHNRLLAFAQVAQGLPNRIALRERIRDHVKALGRSRVDQLEIALAPFEAGDVQAVACELILLGLLEIEHDVELTRHSVLTWAGAA